MSIDKDCFNKVNIINDINDLTVQDHDKNVIIENIDLYNITVKDDKDNVSTLIATEESVKIIETTQQGLKGGKGEDGVSPVIKIENNELTGDIEFIAGSNVLLETDIDKNQIKFNVTQSGAGSGDLSYIHYQPIPLAVWIITHNLNKHPSVTTVDSAGATVMGDVQYISLNEVKVTFAGGFGGRAYLN